MLVCIWNEFESLQINECNAFRASAPTRCKNALNLKIGANLQSFEANYQAIDLKLLEQLTFALERIPPNTNANDLTEYGAIGTTVQNVIWLIS